jgi:dihydroorotase
MTVVIKGARLYGEGDPVDVLVSDGQIAEIGTGVKAAKGTEMIDAAGQILLPGLVDLHTHLREPGREYAEDIETGSAAAALGGFTAVFAMANTDPVADSPVVTDHVWRRGQQVGLVDVHPVGAVTVGLEGSQLTEMGLMNAGVARVRLFSDDGVCVADPLVMRHPFLHVLACLGRAHHHLALPALARRRGKHEMQVGHRLGQGFEYFGTVEDMFGTGGGRTGLLVQPVVARPDDAQFEQAEIGHGTGHHADILTQLRFDQENDRPCAQRWTGVICSGSGHMLFRFT